ncbi:MAG: polysaccharide biosynthesis/export family protein [Coleofasciculaceae cyanobacterium]
MMATVAIAVTSSPGSALPLSPGDRLRVYLPDEGLPEGSDISGTYEVNYDGNLEFPYISALRVAGREPSEVEGMLKSALVRAGLFQPDFVRVSVKLFEYAPVQVTVGGAVFEPGRALINQRGERGSRLRDLPGDFIPATGDYATERYVTSALIAVGGVKPNADVGNIRLIRGGRERIIDLSGVFTGGITNDVPLISGDQIIVPQSEQIRNELVRPSQITPEQVQVFVSNSTEEAPQRVEAVNFEYGTRLSSAVVLSGCAGGTENNSAKRRTALIQTNRLTGETAVVDQPVERLLRESNDNESNPFLMPRDAIACYDSKIENVRGIFNIFRDILSPINTFENLIRRIFD